MKIIEQTVTLLKTKVENPERMEHVTFIFEDFEEKFTAGEVVVETVLDTVFPNVV